MRAAAIAVAVVVGLALGAPAHAAPIGFDHATHEGKVVVAGKDAVTCAGCHPLAKTGRGVLLGRPGHAACFGDCHGAAPRAGVATPPEQAEVCAACHDAGDLAAKRTAVAYPPYRLDPDFGLQISHAVHVGAACTTCHTVPGAAATAAVRPHARCASCHDGRAGAAAMTECTTCHLAAFGANASPRLVRGPLPVGNTFSHRQHAARPATGAAKDALACAGCHRAIATATALELPAPTTASCATAGCHDGAAAFATTDSCRRCHAGPPPIATQVMRPPERFSHPAHAGRLDIDGCASCHTIDKHGEPRSAGHRACVACHADHFSSPDPGICGACHASTEPWRALTVDRMPPPTSDFGASLDHGRHRDLACERCHNLDTAARELRPPRGHAACTGSGCHADRGGPSPTLLACRSCHRLGLERSHTEERTGAPWSVRARFRHAGHDRDRAGAPLACTGCHTVTTTEPATPGAVAMPPSPAKATCAPCHDGKLAFKMSGHGCARCHGP